MNFQCLGLSEGAWIKMMPGGSFRQNNMSVDDR